MFTNLRAFLLESVLFETIFPNLEGVFTEASVDTLIFIAKKEEKDGLIQVNNFKGEIANTKHIAEQVRFKNNDRNIFDLEVNDKYYSIIEKVKAQSVKLETLSEITRGVNPYDKYRGQSEEIIKSKAYHANYKKDNTFLPEIRGKHVNCYYYQWDQKHYISYGSWLAAPREMKFFQGPRIIMRQVLGEKLNCTSITEDFIIDQSVFIAKPFTLHIPFIDAIQGLLASKLIATFFKLTSNEFDALFPKIKIGEFKELPVFSDLKRVDDSISSLVGLIKKVKQENVKADISDIERKIDLIVYKLYNLTYEEVRVIDESVSEEEYLKTILTI